MGVDFTGHGGFSLAWSEWRGCFALALAFGLEPAGTVAAYDDPNPDSWNGDYFTNDLQKVTDDDAQAMGAAPYRPLAALKDRRHLNDEQAKAGLAKTLPPPMVCRLADYA